MEEYYSDDDKSQWDAYFKMKGETRNPPTESDPHLFSIRKELLDFNNLTPSNADFQSKMVNRCFSII